MAMNPLPPQAYTKDTLVKAYQWLQGQSESIREMATTPEVLVSLYLKAKLQGDGALERPSIQNFKNELKNLAGMMGEFEVVETPQFAQQSTTLHTVPHSSDLPLRGISDGLMMPPPAAQTMPSPSSMAANTSALNSASAATATATAAPSSAGPANRGQMQGLDTRSWLMIQEVKNQLNLSSEQEALRMLISVGHQKIKNLMNP